ncbi:glycosyltransferase family 4 protein [Enterococcus faecium]|uniref:glycosyltransferase family 4 protein n=1 Tax=Enterococcus faecium TaxID=1352 RepID=UPI00138A546E|nr:glycosyltransferase family 4 protein [Enterococcus faecium]
MNGKKKVLFIAHDNYNRSGAFISMCNLAYYLKVNHQVNVMVILPGKGNGAEILESLGIEYKIIKSYDWITPVEFNNNYIKMYKQLKKIIKYSFNLISIARLIVFIKKYNPSIVHINTICSYVGAIAAWYCDIPYVWHIREYLEEDQSLKNFYRKNGEKLINHAACNICISNSVKEKFEKIYPSAKFCRIYNGINTTKFINLNPECNDVNHITCVGGLYPHKGQELLIKAIGNLNYEIRKKIKVHIVGTGKCLDDLQHLVEKLGLKDSIVFEGFSKAPEKFFSSSAITVVPSYFEPFGRVTIEAMLCNSYVIGSNTAGTKELIGDNEYGALFNCGDYCDLSEKIEFALRNPCIIKQIADKARKMALEVFTADRNAHMVNELYNTIFKEEENTDV